MGTEIILRIQSISNAFWDGFFVFFTLFGEELVFVLVIAVLYWCVSKQFAFRLALVWMVSALVNLGLKNLVREPRPYSVEMRKLFSHSAGGYSFPSGHSQTVAAYTGGISQRFFRRKPWAIAGGVALVLLVALSRIYLGHHYLHDVLAGAALGYLFGWLGTWLLAKSRWSDNWYFLLLIPAALLLIFTDSNTVGKAVGGGVSLLLGYRFERRYVKSGQPKNWFFILLRLLAGLSIGAALYFALGAIPVSHRLWEAFCYFVLGLWVTVLAPLTFRCWEGARD